MSETRGPAQTLGHWTAQVLVGIYVIVDSVLSPIFRPFLRWLSSLNVIQAMERGIASLPAYGVLVLLLAPFAVEELLKVWAIVLMGGGHFKTGLLIYIGCHVFSILVCERIFSAGKEKLMTIPWFARLFHWLKGYKGPDGRLVQGDRRLPPHARDERAARRGGETALWRKDAPVRPLRQPTLAICGRRCRAHADANGIAGVFPGAPSYGIQHGPLSLRRGRQNLATPMKIRRTLVLFSHSEQGGVRRVSGRAS